MQSKLLRVLQTGDFSRVGGSRTLRSRARVIAATNRDLNREVQAGRFRADLYYRLNVVTLEVPPLRQRFGDIPVLVRHFSRKFVQPGHEPLGFSSEALQRLCAYGWPGNVRELEHLIERLSVLVTKGEARLSDLPAHFLGVSESAPVAPASTNRPYHEALLEFQRTYFQNLIAAAHGNLAAAARQAGMDRSQFFRKVQSLRLITNS